MIIHIFIEIPKGKDIDDIEDILHSHNLACYVTSETFLTTTLEEIKAIMEDK